MTMKKKLYKAFESVTPDRMDQVMAACPVPAEKTQDGALARRTNQLWYRSALSTAAAVVLFLSVCGVAVWMLSNGNQFGVEDPTETTAQTEPSTEQTLPPETTDPTESQPTPLPPILGYGALNHNEQLPTNPEGIPVIEYGYHNNYYSNGFILDSTGEAFLSLHGGELKWVDSTAGDIQVNHNGTDHRFRFVWCSYAGEVGLISEKPGLVPILGNDRYVSLRVEKYPYLLDLQTMMVLDPFGGLNLDPTAISITYAPDLESCLVTVDDVHHLVDFSSREMTPLTELAGLENVSYAYYVNQDILALVDVFEDEYPQEWQANGYLYSIQDGTLKELYNDVSFGWLSDTGGVEHYGSMYLNFQKQGLRITDCISGKQTLTDIAHIPIHTHCGADQVLVTVKESYEAHESVDCLLSSDGTVTPLFVHDADTLVESILGELSPADPSVNTKHPWYVGTPPTVSYEEFFSRPRVLTPSDGSVWTAPTGTEYILRTTDEGLQVWQNNGGRAFYTVPGFEGPDCGVTPAFCNGNTAYVYSDTQLLRLDVMTGEYTVVAEFDRVMGTSGRGPYLLYFAAVRGEKLDIYQIYAPTNTVELLCSESSAKTAPGWFEFGVQKTTQDPVVWEMVNPKAYTILEQEIRNAGSVLLEDAYIAENFGALWANPEKLDEELQYDGRVSILLRTMQDKFGLSALVRCSYDPITGEYTEKEGVLDSCSFGSGIGHDHFAPEETAEIIPTVIDTKVTAIEGLTPPSAEIADKMREEWGNQHQTKYTVYAEQYDYHYLCIKESGNYRRVCDIPMRSTYEIIYNANGAYFITLEGTLLWMDKEEKITQIYQAQFGELRELEYCNGKLAVVDGDHIVMLDLVECTCSVILYHPGSIWMYFDSDNELYVDITLGLDVRAYLFNFETGVLAQTNYRL